MVNMVGIKQYGEISSEKFPPVTDLEKTHDL